MHSYSSAAVLLCVFLLSPKSFGATIGDGSRSLYTGKPIDGNVTRGSCLADGILYMSETSIPRDHSCHYCICYQSQVTCYWKQCAAPPINCDVMEFENVCNPSLYVCEIPEKAVREPVLTYGDRIDAPRRKRKLYRRRIVKAKPLRVSLGHVALRRGRRVKRGLTAPFDEGFPVPFEEAFETYVRREGSSRTKRAIGSPIRGRPNSLLLADTSCSVFGVKYNLGEVIGVASDVCMECRCAAGAMFCSPKCCFLPSPFAIGTSEGNALFIKASSREVLTPPHPLHYVRNQFTEGQFLR